jgi:probable HAF family extracellular repeat protein
MRARLITAGVCIGAAVLAHAQYSIVDLGGLGDQSQARAINDLAQIAGIALPPVSGAVPRAVLWQTGSVADLGILGGYQSWGLGINNVGTVCGWAENASGYDLPALWNGGTATALPTLGWTGGAAYGINNAGTAVGFSYLSPGVYHAGIWSSGGVRDLGTLAGGTISAAYDINNRGQVVGTASTSSDFEQAVLWGLAGPVDLGGLSGGKWTRAVAVNDSEQMILWGTPAGAASNHAAFWDGDPTSPVIDLGTFGGNQSWAYGLNDYGFVVGSADEPDWTYHAFVWDGHEKIDLGTLGGPQSVAFGINDKGIIVGWANDENALIHAVEWVPVPEPTAFFVGLLGLALSVCRRVGLRRHRHQPGLFRSARHGGVMPNKNAR